MNQQTDKSLSFPPSTVLVVFVLALLGFYVAIVANHIKGPPIDLHQFRQTQTASTIYNYVIKGVNLLEPELDSNGNASVVVLEFPIYQALVAVVSKATGYSDAVGRVLNVVMTLLTAATLCFLGRVLQTWRLGALMAGSFLVMPSSIFWSRTILIDPLVVMLGTIFITTRLWQRQSTARRWMLLLSGVLASLSLGLGLLVKAPTMAGFLVFDCVFVSYALLPSGRLEHQRGGDKSHGCRSCSASLRSELTRSTLVYLPAFLAFGAWRLFCAKMHALNPHQYSEVGMEWYMGALEQRFEGWRWASLLPRLLWNHLGIVVLPAVVVSLVLLLRRTVLRAPHHDPSALFEGMDALRIQKANVVSLGVAIFAAVCAATLYLVVFFNANLIHTYYQLPVNVFFAILFAAAFYVILGTTPSRGSATLLLGGTSLALLVVSSLTLFGGRWRDLSTNDPFAVANVEFLAARYARRFVSSDPQRHDRPLVYVAEAQDVWSGPHALLYYLRRRGRVEVVSRETSEIAVGPEFGVAVTVTAREASPPSGFVKRGCKAVGATESKWLTCVFVRQPNSTGDENKR